MLQEKNEAEQSSKVQERRRYAERAEFFILPQEITSKLPYIYYVLYDTSNKIHYNALLEQTHIPPEQQHTNNHRANATPDAE